MSTTTHSTGGSHLSVSQHCPVPRSARAGRARRRHRQTGAPKCGLCCALRPRMRNRRAWPTLQDGRKLDAKSRATSIVWSTVGLACGACPVCVAVPQRRLRGDLLLPAGQQTHWDQQPRREARTGRRHGPHRPRSEARHGQQRRPGSRSGGGWRPSGQEEPRGSS